MPPAAIRDSSAPTVPRNLVRVGWSRSGKDAWRSFPTRCQPSYSSTAPRRTRSRTPRYTLGRLAGATATIDDRLHVLVPLQYREALLSSRIDRVVTTPERLVLMAAGVPDAGSHEEQGHTRSVLRYVRTIDYGLASKLPISVRLISELRAVLVTDETERHRRDDEPQDAVEPASGTADQPRVVRLPVREMQSCLDAFEARLQTMPASMPGLVELALLHYQFEAIHPFRQGNGRVGRLMLPLMLFRQNRLPQPLLFVSAYLERHRDEYFESLRAVSRRSAWLPWVTFFLRGVEESATESLEHAESLFELHDHYHALFHESDWYISLRPLIDGLFVLPCTSVAKAASSCEMTEQAASAAIDALVAQGILFGVDGPGPERLFLAPAILGFMRNREESTRSILGSGSPSADSASARLICRRQDDSGSGIEDDVGVTVEDEPGALRCLVLELPGSPSGVADIHTEPLRPDAGCDRLLQHIACVDEIHVAHDVAAAGARRRRSEQREHAGNRHRSAEERRGGAPWRFDARQDRRQRHFRRPVDDEAQRAFSIEIREQDHRRREVRIRKVA